MVSLSFILPDYSQAVQWYRKAANLGHHAAADNLKDLLLKSVHRKKEDREEIYQRVVAQSGGKYPEQYFEMAQSAIQGKGSEEYRFSQALIWAHKGAILIDREIGELSQGLSAEECYLKGKNSSNKANQEYYKNRFEKLCSHSPFTTSVVFYCRVAEAFAWHFRSASMGYVDAMYELGVCYSHRAAYQDADPAQGRAGYGKMTSEKAIEWYHKASEQGHAQATYMVGFCYEKGEGVQKDRSLALEWYQKAAAMGDSDAARRIRWITTGLRGLLGI